jgi:hypothetical protein
VSNIGTCDSRDSAAIFHASEKIVYNPGTNEENICTSFCLPLRDSRALITITSGQDGGLWRRYMSDQQIAHPTVVQPLAMDSIQPVALKWRNLIERRRAHFIELYLTGRWKRYYTEEQFVVIFRDTMNIADRWTEIAPKPGDAEPQAS